MKIRITMRMVRESGTMFYCVFFCYCCSGWMTVERGEGVSFILSPEKRFSFFIFVYYWFVSERRESGALQHARARPSFTSKSRRCRRCPYLSSSKPWKTCPGIYSRYTVNKTCPFTSIKVRVYSTNTSQLCTPPSLPPQQQQLQPHTHTKVALLSEMSRQDSPTKF